MDFEFDRVAAGRVIKFLVIDGVADDPPPYDLVQVAGFCSMHTGPWAANYRRYDCVSRELPALAGAAPPDTDV